MLETLAKGFRAARQRLTGVAELTDDVIDEALRDVRLSLLEGDVEFRVVKRFLERVREAARGEQVELKREDEGVRRQDDHARAGVREDLPGRAHRDDGARSTPISAGRRRARPAS